MLALLVSCLYLFDFIANSLATLINISLFG
jgi:hypothetical protein